MTNIMWDGLSTLGLGSLLLGALVGLGEPRSGHSQRDASGHHDLGAPAGSVTLGLP